MKISKRTMSSGESVSSTGVGPVLWPGASGVEGSCARWLTGLVGPLGAAVVFRASSKARMELPRLRLRGGEIALPSGDSGPPSPATPGTCNA